MGSCPMREVLEQRCDGRNTGMSSAHRGAVWLEYNIGGKELGAASGKEAEVNVRTCVCTCVAGSLV